MIACVLLFPAVLAVTAPRLTEDAFYRFALGGASGVVVSLQVNGPAPNEVSLSVAIPASVLRSLNPHITQDVSLVCERVPLSFVIESPDYFVAPVPVADDPCLSYLKRAAVDVHGVSVIPDALRLKYWPTQDKFSVSIVVDAVLRRCSPEDPLLDDEN